MTDRKAHSAALRVTRGAVMVLALLVAGAPAGAQKAPDTTSQVTRLMQRGLYQDAVRLLTAEIAKLPEARAGRLMLMLGESHYMLGEHAQARPWFAKALPNVSAESDKTVAEYRLACVAYRMGDRAGAIKQIDTFLVRHAGDRRTGTLMVFKMNLLAERGKGSQAAVEALHKDLTSARQFGSAVRLAADKILTDYYVAQGLEDKAKERYTSIVHNFRNVISQYAREKRPIPAGMEQAHDHAAMQLGILSVKARKYDEAVKWLENIRYDAELQRKARLLLAQVAYQRRDFDRATRYLTREGFIDTVPPGPLRSDMNLLLGLCEKNSSSPDYRKMESYLAQVEPGAEGYAQAQLALGDLYREKGLTTRAIAAYEHALPSPKYEANALFHLGQLHIAQADEEKLPPARESLYRKAAQHLSQLATKYPTSVLAKEAGKSIDLLLGKGFDVSVATSDAERVRLWEQAARTQAGSDTAARALISLARLHNKTLADEKTRKLVKAPNHLACAAACDKLLDEKLYSGAGFEPEQWQALRVEALYFRGLSHLASASAPAKPPAGIVTATYVRRPELPQAIDDLTQARRQVDPKRLDLVRNVELALLEAMFKSDQGDLREKAEARFAELVNEYGTDARFQKLALDLAEWYRDQGRYTDAAREYKGIADRGANLPQEDVLKALFEAGKLYSRAAYEARLKPGKITYGVYIHPKEVIRLGGVLETYKPFQKPIRLWPASVKDINAAQALKEISKASGIPFVWRPSGDKLSVDRYLKDRKVTFTTLTGTAAELLGEVLDLTNHRLGFDIGLTGGEPTIAPKPADADDPEAAEAVKTIEIYDARRWTERYEPLSRKYGAWRSVHRSSAMFFHVVQRIEEITETRILWAEGVRKEDALAAEFDKPGELDLYRSYTCAEVLAQLANALDLRAKIVPRDRSAELYGLAKDCFNEIRKISPKSTHGENSLFLLALNFYRQADYERMKIVLREYLKLFDSPSHEHYHEACFWVGWALEHEKRYRDACLWYNRAAEERLVIRRPAKDEKPPSRRELKDRLSYDTAFALEEVADGEMKDWKLEVELLEFLRLNANVAVRVDVSAAGLDTPIHHPPFKQATIFDVLCDVLEGLGLTVGVENVNEPVARKAYYRLASSHKKDGLMRQALTTCNVLLGRYPDTERTRDAYKLKLEIYKGLKDYRNVLATLEGLKSKLGDDIEAYKIDFEMAWIYFDLCRYDKAIEHFRKSLGGAKDPRERVSIRDGFARALFQQGDLPEALNQYQALVKDEPEPLRAFVDGLMVWYLEFATGKSSTTRLPPDVSKLMAQYLALSDETRGKLSKEALAKVTWVYYVAGLVDLKNGESLRALEKLQAAGNSPDDWLAADAIYRTALIHIQAKDYRKAREALEYLLFSTKSAEAEVKGTFALGLCLEALGEAERARARFEQLLARFPESAYAAQARAHRGATQPATAPASRKAN